MIAVCAGILCAGVALGWFLRGRTDQIKNEWTTLDYRPVHRRSAVVMHNGGPLVHSFVADTWVTEEEQLKTDLALALENEDYEWAAEVRDKQKNLKSKS